MNYQILLESYAAGEWINKDEISLLELELDSQLALLNFLALKVAQKKHHSTFARQLKFAKVVVGSLALLQY